MFPLLLVRSLLAGCCIMGLITCQSSPPKLQVVYINSARVMQHYQGTAAKRQQIGQLAARWQQGLDSLTTVLQQSTLSVATKQARTTQYRDQVQRRLQTASQQADQELLQEVNQYLQEFGKQQHYDFILGATESGNVVYAAASRDVTQAVLQGLNQQYVRQQAAQNTRR